MSISVIEAAGPNDVTDFRFRGLRKVLVGGIKSNIYIDQRYVCLRSNLVKNPLLTEVTAVWWLLLASLAWCWWVDTIV